MTEATKQTSEAAIKRFRSPPYPFITLQKAIERARELYSKAAHHPVGIAVLGDVWGYGLKSSGLDQTIAALIQFGFLTDEGSGEKRRFELTSDAIRIVQDADPMSEKRKAAIRRAALSPKIHNELWEKYGPGTDVPDVVLKNYLMLDRRDAGQAPYSDSSATDLVEKYKTTIKFSGLEKSSSISGAKGDKIAVGGNLSLSRKPSDEHATIKVGEYVQWTSGGADQFKTPRQVVWISEDKSHLRVHGSTTGIPMSEVTVVDAPAPPPIGEPQEPVIANSAWAQGKNELNVLQRGDRLEITATVDLEGLENLKEVLGHYENILKLLKPKK